MRRAAGVFATALLLASCRNAAPRPAPSIDAEQAQRQREDALARARVWMAPKVTVARADLKQNPGGPRSFGTSDEVTCRFTPRPAGGTTPKFYCALPDGDTVKVKYDERNAELPAEVAATRLLTALGFLTDRMYLVASLRCYGCPPLPYEALECLKKTAAAVCLAGADAGRPVRFPHAVIERVYPGKAIEAVADEGWSWYELDRIDPARGGSPRAHVDALRLLAIVLVHWDNKGANQRLLCPPGGATDGGPCRSPLALVQDLGATFGPLKLDLQNWRTVPVWADARRCTVSMRQLPYDGGTFGEHAITEEGRQFALSLLKQLTDAQLRDLFVASGVTAFNHVVAEAHDAHAWVRAFRDKVTAIEQGGPCPAPDR